MAMKFRFFDGPMDGLYLAVSPGLDVIDFPIREVQEPMWTAEPSMKPPKIRIATYVQAKRWMRNPRRIEVVYRWKP